MAETTGIVRPNRQRRRTRTALLTAGQRLFALHGRNGVSIDAIVESAEVSKGSFYNHFKDKEAFARAILLSAQEDLESDVEAANKDVDDPAERVVRALCVALRYAHDHPERLQALLNLAERGTRLDSPLNAGVSADIADGIRKKRLAVSDIETGVLVTLGMITITIRHAMFNDVDTSGTGLPVRMGTALLQALGMPLTEAHGLAQAASDDLAQR